MSLTTRPKKPSHYKKRQAHHHRHSKRYVKAYLPYLPLLGVFGLLLALNSLWSQPQVLGNTSDFSAAQLLTLTNKERTHHQLQSLQLNPQLMAAAQAKASDLIGRNYWSHVSPSGQDPSSLIADSGYNFQIAGENLAYGFRDAGQVISGWLNSPEHRQNVLGSSYSDVGFGVASSPNYLGKGPETVVVAEYAAPVPVAAHITFQVDNPVRTASPEVKGSQAEIPSRQVARVQILTGGQAPWSLVAVAMLMGAAVTLFVLRNGFRIQRMLSRGEAFIAHHPWFDVAMLLLAAAGYLLSRTGGFVR